MSLQARPQLGGDPGQVGVDLGDLGSPKAGGAGPHGDPTGGLGGGLGAGGAGYGGRPGIDEGQGFFGGAGVMFRNHFILSQQISSDKVDPTQFLGALTQGYPALAQAIANRDQATINEGSKWAWELVKQAGLEKQFMDDKGLVDVELLSNALCIPVDGIQAFADALAKSGVKIKNVPTPAPSGAAKEPAPGAAVGADGGANATASQLLSPARRAAQASAEAAKNPDAVSVSPARPPSSATPAVPGGWQRSPGCELNPDFNQDNNNDDQDQNANEEEEQPQEQPSNPGPGGGGPQDPGPPQGGGGQGPGGGSPQTPKQPEMGKMGPISPFPKIDRPDEMNLLKQIAEAGVVRDETNPQGSIKGIEDASRAAAAVYQGFGANPLPFRPAAKKQTETKNALQQYANSPRKGAIDSSSRGKSPFNGLFKN